VCASISHTRDTAVCLGGRQPDLLGVGVDVEDEFSAPAAEEIRRQVIDDREFGLLKAGFERYTQGLTAIFSAKESFYKAAAQWADGPIGFCALKLTAVHPAEMVFRLVTDLCGDLTAGKAISVSYTLNDSGVETAVCLLRESIRKTQS
jgi:enterobactin synthetase component D